MTELMFSIWSFLSFAKAIVATGGRRTYTLICNSQSYIHDKCDTISSPLYRHIYTTDEYLCLPLAHIVRTVFRFIFGFSLALYYDIR